MAIPVTDEVAVIGSFVLRVQLICRQLQMLHRTLTQFAQEIATAYATHPDQPIFASLPGGGPVLGQRLLATMGVNRDRFGSPPSSSNSIQAWHR